MAGRPREIEVSKNDRFGLLLVLDPEVYQKGRRMARVKCTDCGKISLVRVADLRGYTNGRIGQKSLHHGGARGGAR